MDSPGFRWVDIPLPWLAYIGMHRTKPSNACIMCFPSRVGAEAIVCFSAVAVTESDACLVAVTVFKTVAPTLRVGG